MVRCGATRRAARVHSLGRQPPFDPTTASAWFRFRIGTTVTGSGVSTWADQSGKGHDLLQATDANRPALQADSTILFDGATQFLKCSAFTLNQPTTIYLLFRQVTWTATDRVMDGNGAGTGQVLQTNVSPELDLFAGAGPVAANTNLVVNTYGAAAFVFNGASSLIQVNSTAATTGNAGAGNMGGFTLAANAAGGQCSNIQVKEIIIFPTADNQATRDLIIGYLNAL